MNNNDVTLQKFIDEMKSDLNTIRTGRATPAIVENVIVEAYDTKMPLLELATIMAPDPRTISIQPWDTGNLSPIRKAIEAANLGLTPNINENNIIMITIPPLTEERRKEFVKRVKSLIEETKVKMRSWRQKEIKDIDTSEKDKEISEDEAKRQKESIQKVLDVFIQKADEIGLAKEHELMQI